jgi:hypothetical protein
MTPPVEVSAATCDERRRPRLGRTLLSALTRALATKSEEAMGRSSETPGTAATERQVLLATLAVARAATLALTPRINALQSRVGLRRISAG